jgi:tetratricopeptide (TPR) repeat protein
MNQNLSKWVRSAVFLCLLSSSFPAWGEVIYRAPRAVELEQLISSAPSDGLLRGQLGDVLLRLGQPQEAEKAYRKALALGQHSVKVHLGLGQALAAQDRWPEARQLLESVPTTAPGAIEIAHALARLYSASPDPSVRDSAKAIQQVQRIRRPTSPPQHLAAMAMVAASNGYMPQAEKLQQRALQAAQRLGRNDLMEGLKADYARYREGQPAKMPWSPEQFSSTPLAPIDDGRPLPQILAEIALEADPTKNNYLNEQRIVSLEKKLKTATGKPYFSLKFEQAWELLRAGHTERALEQIAGLVKTFEEQGVKDSSDDLRRLRELYAVAYLRLGEQQNCVQHAGKDACLLPLKDKAIHQQRRGSEGAIDQLTRLLKVNPDDLANRWLLNLAWMTLDGWPEQVPAAWRLPADSFDSDFDIGRFLNQAAVANADVNSLAGGVSLEDFDGDGDLDIATSSWGLEDPLRYLRNEGDGTFSDQSEAAGVSPLLGGLNLIHADYDNDGDNDILVLRGAWLSSEGRHPNSLLRNDGKGRFTDVTRETGLLRRAPTQSAIWLDFDLDGHVDLFVGNESTQGSPYPSELFRNNGDGTFRDVSRIVGIGDLGFVKGVTAGDFDNDGWPDLFVSRYMEPNLLLRNVNTERGTRLFRDVSAHAGVQAPNYSFPAWFFDYDNDGWLDLYVASFADFWGDSLAQVVADYLGDSGQSDGARSHLYRNNRDGTFTNVAPKLGLDDVLLAMGANFGDLDNDGRLDIYVGTGLPRMNTLVPNRMYRNAGETFQDVTTSGGFGHLQKGHGIAFGDIDADGDQDIYAVMGGAFSGDRFANALFINPGHGNHWLTLRLRGTKSHRSAIGARVRVLVEESSGERRSIYSTVGSGGSFGSSSLQQEIGLGSATRVLAVDIDWPNRDRMVERFGPFEMDQAIDLREGTGKRVRINPATPSAD